MKKSISTLLVAFSIFAFAGCLPGMNSGGNSYSDESDYQYSILLQRFYNSDMHATHAQKAAEAWSKETGWPDIFAVGEEKFSGTYFGKFKTLEDARAQLHAVRSYRYNGRCPFERAVAISMPGISKGSDRDNLKKTTEGIYTAVVAIFYNDPERGITNRKSQAVYTCEKLNEQFKKLPAAIDNPNIYRAFYFHGPQRSMVTIGLFPASAIVYKDQIMRIAGQSKVTKQTVAVYKNKHLIKFLNKDYPELTVNGYPERMNVPSIDPKTGRAVYALASSYAIKIPGRSVPRTTAPRRTGSPNTNRNTGRGNIDLNEFIGE